MLPLGTLIPNFNLLNVMDNEEFKSSDITDKATVIMVICNHCPYVIHYHDEIKSIISKFVYTVWLLDWAITKPINKIKLTEGQMLDIKKLINYLEEDDDVQNVYTNLDYEV